MFTTVPELCVNNHGNVFNIILALFKIILFPQQKISHHQNLLNTPIIDLSSNSLSLTSILSILCF